MKRLIFDCLLLAANACAPLETWEEDGHQDSVGNWKVDTDCGAEGRTEVVQPNPSVPGVDEDFVSPELSGGMRV